MPVRGDYNARLEGRITYPFLIEKNSRIELRKDLIAFDIVRGFDEELRSVSLRLRSHLAVRGS
jgi:hypothetical protein